MFKLNAEDIIPSEIELYYWVVLLTPEQILSEIELAWLLAQ